jgi:hypothetical protein
MESGTVPFEVKYRGSLYRLRSADGLGTTGADKNFSIIRKDYPTETRELLYSGGAFVLEITLKWNFAPGVEASFPVTLDADDAPLIFLALSRDGGVLSEEYKRLVTDGDVPGPVEQVTKGLAPKQQKQLTAATKRVAILLRWEGEKLLRVRPDEEVARVIFRLCTPAKGFSVGDIPYKDAPRDLVEKFSQDLHVELMQMFPGAIVDTQVVDEPDPHCGHPIVLNKLNVPVKGYDAKVNMLAMDLWRDYYREYKQGQQES